MISVRTKEALARRPKARGSAIRASRDQVGFRAIVPEPGLVSVSALPPLEASCRLIAPGTGTHR
jgi:hypothetical protein